MYLGCVRLLLLVSTLALTACSGYDARWSAAKAAPRLDPYSGAWKGTWTSARHAGAGDSLHCILTPASGEGSYLAEFKARWLKIFTSTHQVVLQTKGRRAGKMVRDFSGSAKLSTSVGGGTYRCEGTMTPERMEAKYEATYDTGTFALERVSSAR